MRLDEYIFSKGLSETVRQAAAFIMAGQVYIGDTKAESAGQQVGEGSEVTVRGKKQPYVSRGGLKLEKAIRVFPINLSGKVCIDIGASSGGFTDCMLQNGAKKVYAVDVAYGQLAWSLRCDKRVENMERFNIRKIKRQDIGEEIEFFSADVSFISLKHIFSVLPGITAVGAQGVCLIKPQFEARKEQVGAKGVVLDAAVHIEVIQKTVGYVGSAGFCVKGLEYSPLKGPKGNIEFLLFVEKSDGEPLQNSEIEECVLSAHKNLLEGELYHENKDTTQRK